MVSLDGGQLNATRATAESCSVAGPLVNRRWRGSLLLLSNIVEDEAGGSGRPPRILLAFSFEPPHCDSCCAVGVLTATLAAWRIAGGDCGAIVSDLMLRFDDDVEPRR